MRKIGLLLVAVVAVGVLSSCSHYASSNSDTYVCVFDGSERGGQKLKDRIPPGAKSEKIDDNDHVVKIPASNRFYMVTGSENDADRSLADPGTPAAYTGNASGGAPVKVEGQVRFRFNLDKACDWYSKHGRRNANGDDLGFNVRGDANQGWFRFLNENFGLTMQEVVSTRISSYDWAALHFNYPTNAGPDGIVAQGTKPAEPTRDALGKDLGVAFTERLKANLGDDYFCGIDPDPNGQTSCPPMRFQVRYAGPGAKSSLVVDRQQVEDTKQKLETARLQGNLQSQQQAQLIQAEANKAALLAKQADSADQQARIDTAKCRQLAPFGLDCEGHRPNGGSVTVTQGK